VCDRQRDRERERARERERERERRLAIIFHNGGAGRPQEDTKGEVEQCEYMRHSIYTYV
jgi:hypothetical protein